MGRPGGSEPVSLPCSSVAYLKLVTRNWLAEGTEEKVRRYKPTAKGTSALHFMELGR
ncbi:MAG: hypothetical protein HPY61_06930 [Methanotrichaceae archaeon]|nr:hypothetical protein [Methanotrichaceae archaeon]